MTNDSKLALGVVELFVSAFLITRPVSCTVPGCEANVGKIMGVISGVAGLVALQTIYDGLIEK